MCRKKEYHSEYSAQRVADDLNRQEYAAGASRPDYPITVYFCKDHHSYHIGHSYDPVQGERVQQQIINAKGSVNVPTS